MHFTAQCEHIPWLKINLKDSHVVRGPGAPLPPAQGEDGCVGDLPATASVLQCLGGTASLNLSLQFHFNEDESNFTSCWEAHHEAIISCLAIGLLDPLLVFCCPRHSCLFLPTLSLSTGLAEAAREQVWLKNYIGKGKTYDISCIISHAVQ